MSAPLQPHWASSAVQSVLTKVPNSHQGGIISVIEDLGQISYNVWGKVKRTLVGFGFSARADLLSADMETIDLDLSVDGENASAQVTATAGLVH